jgi:GDPmannose 4,6-dehydratase
MLQLKKPDDFVIATGKQYSVKDFINLAAKKLNINIIWSGKGLNEIGVDKKTNKIIIEIDKKYFRPTEVESLKGDYKKAKKILKWQPTINFKELVDEMVTSDFNIQKNQ